jgi:outer membrane immunogenic protein
MAASVYKQKTLNSGVVMTKNVLLATAAFAIASAAAVPAQAGNWSGIYLGGNAGGMWGTVDTTVASKSGAAFSPTVGSTESFSPSGVFGGGQIGYNYQMSNLVFGLELAGDFTDFDKALSTTDSDIVTVNSDWNAAASLRAGYVFSYGALVYLKGGYAMADLKHSWADGGSSASFSDSNTVNGWQAGAGYEYLISSDVSVGLEYTYADYGSDTFTGTSGLITATHDVETKIQTVSARLNWHFNP